MKRSPMQYLKSRLILSKSKRKIKPTTRIIKPTKSQRTATIRAYKGLLESSRFIKEEPLI